MEKMKAKRSREQKKKKKTKIFSSRIQLKASVSCCWPKVAEADVKLAYRCRKGLLKPLKKAESPKRKKKSYANS